MPNLQSPAVALCISDIHWSHKAPSTRIKEPDWYEAQARHIRRLYEIWSEVGRPPILMAGDLFHKWNEPIGLVSFISEQLELYFGQSPIFVIPGQHDLPYHSDTVIERSAYHGLLRMCPWITCLRGNEEGWTSNIRVIGYGWNDEQSEYEGQQDPDKISIAMVHRFAYNGKDTGFVGVENHGDTAYRLCYPGYDFTHYGDNHIPWHSSNVINPGTFQVRNKDDIPKNLGAYTIHEDRTISHHPFHRDGDVIEAPLSVETVEGPSADEVIERLKATDTSIGSSLFEMLRSGLSQSAADESVKGEIMKLYKELEK